MFLLLMFSFVNPYEYTSMFHFARRASAAIRRRLLKRELYKQESVGSNVDVLLYMCCVLFTTCSDAGVPQKCSGPLWYHPPSILDHFGSILITNRLTMHMKQNHIRIGIQIVPCYSLTGALHIHIYIYNVIYIYIH